MTSSDIGQPQVPTDGRLLVEFLIDLRSDLKAWTSGDGANETLHGSILFPDSDLRALARAAFEDGVGQRLSTLIAALERNWNLYEPALRLRGLTGPNLELKTTMARRFRNPSPDRTLSTRELFRDLGRYLGVASSILGSLKEALEKGMPWWLKLLVELIKEFVDMAEAQASARSEGA